MQLFTISFPRKGPLTDAGEGDGGTFKKRKYFILYIIYYVYFIPLYIYINIFKYISYPGQLARTPGTCCSNNPNMLFEHTVQKLRATRWRRCVKMRCAEAHQLCGVFKQDVLGVQTACSGFQTA